MSLRYVTTMIPRVSARDHCNIGFSSPPLKIFWSPEHLIGTFFSQGKNPCSRGVSISSLKQDFSPYIQTVSVPNINITKLRHVCKYQPGANVCDKHFRRRRRQNIWGHLSIYRLNSGLCICYQLQCFQTGPKLGPSSEFGKSLPKGVRIS